MPGIVRPLRFKDITKTQPWKPEERQTGGGKCNKENGTTVRIGKGDLVQTAIKRKHKRTARQSL